MRYRDAGVARDYDQLRQTGWVRRRREAMMRRLLARGLAGLAPGSLVLDVPCGTGRITPWLAARGLRVIGADLSRDMLGEAQAKVAGVRGCLGLLVGDAAQLPFADQSLDAALLVRFLHLVEDAERVPLFRELSRVVRGRVLLHVGLQAWTAKRLLRRVRGVPLKPVKVQWKPLLAQLEEGGLRVERVHRKLPFASTSVVVVCRPAHSVQGA
ncbi:MAG: class I SAM-dependent methyltransferase [Planctomycetes bacterium]|nr:class I SAM-dependent methyltransferase [Planctomycetota bacterium]